MLSFVEPQQARDVAKLHGAASVRADTTTVYAGHPAVREVAESGEPIVVAPLPERRTAAPQRPASRSGGPRRSGGPYSRPRQRPARQARAS